jgi:predicted PurR-regulated permease PerM
MFLIRGFLLPFVIGIILAYLLMPLVDWLHKKLPPRAKWPNFRRFLAVIIVFILLICLVGGFLYLLVSTIINASVTLINNTPAFLSDAFNRVQQWFEGIISSLPPDVQQQVRDAFSGSASTIGNSIRDAFLGAFSAIPAAFDVILGFAVLPFFLFYLLKDHEKLKRDLSSGLPSGVVRHGRNVVSIIEKVLGRYTRSQLLLGFVVGLLSYIGLRSLGVPYAVALALMAGVGEVIPTLGPWLAGALAVIVTLAAAPEKTLWVALLYFGIQIVENSLLVPKIQSSFLRIHPAVMIVLLVFGAYVAGIWGLILIGPLTATLVEIYKYIMDCYTCRETLNIPGP